MVAERVKTEFQASISMPSGQTLVLAEQINISMFISLKMTLDRWNFKVGHGIQTLIYVSDLKKM